MGAFKSYCRQNFEEKLAYYSTELFSGLGESGGSNSPKPKRNDRVAVRFEHPTLYKRLKTPIVHAKTRHLLKYIYVQGHSTNPERDIFEAPHRKLTDRAMPQMSLG